MNDIGYWDAQMAAGTIVAFGASGDYRYQITAVDECDGYACPVGAGCVAKLDLTDVDYPRLGFDEVHVGPAVDVDTLGHGKAVA